MITEPSDTNTVFLDHLYKRVDLNRYAQAYSPTTEIETSIPISTQKVIEEEVKVTQLKDYFNNIFCRKIRTAILRHVENFCIAAKVSWNLFIRNNGETTTTLWSFEPIIV